MSILTRSKNGTFVNGRRVTKHVPHVLMAGDSITLGAPSQAPVKLLFVVDATSTVGGGGSASEGVIRYLQGHPDEASDDVIEAANLAQPLRSFHGIEAANTSVTAAITKRERSPSEDGTPTSYVVTDGVRAFLNRSFHDDFDIIAAEDLGRGSFASVRRCVHRRSGVVYAVKEVNRLRLQVTAGASAEEQIRLEAAVLLCCAHPNVVRVVAFYEEPARFLQVMELMQDGDLQSKIYDKAMDAERRAARAASVPSGPAQPAASSSPSSAAIACTAPTPAQPEPPAVKPFPEAQARQIFVQICEGLRYIHDEACVAHRDIKPANILCNRLTTARPGSSAPISRWWFKLADGLFRSSEEVPGPAVAGPVTNVAGQMVTVAGTDTFMAPEMVALATSFASPSVMYTLPESAESAVEDDLSPADGAAQHSNPHAEASVGTGAEASQSESKRRRRKRRAHMTYGKEVDLFSLGVVLHIILSGQHPFRHTCGRVPAVAVCQAKQAVRGALKEAAAARRLVGTGDAVEDCELLGAEVFAKDDPLALSALEAECSASQAQLADATDVPSSIAAATTSSAAGSSAAAAAGEARNRSDRWGPDLSSPEWADVSVEAKSLVLALMDPDPRQRPTAAQCLNHTWTRSEATKQLRSTRRRARPFVGDIDALVDPMLLHRSDSGRGEEQKPFALLAEDVLIPSTTRAPPPVSSTTVLAAANRSGGVDNIAAAEGTE